jgi:peptide/nickel transport system permease protein
MEGADPQFREMIRKMWGLDKPLYEQLAIYWWEVLHGNLGYSYIYREPVISLIAERAGATFLLMGTSLILASIIGTVLGAIAAQKPNSLRDHVIRIFSLAGYSIPTFWSGILLLLVFSLYLGLFPSSGMSDIHGANPLSTLHHLTLPALTMSFYTTGLITRVARSSLLDVLTENYIITARAKGLDEKSVLFKHALKNGFLPILTIIGIEVGGMITGAIFIETVFGWPGLGTLLYAAVLRRDYPLIMGMFIFISLLVTIATLVVDLLYGFIDPRVRLK